MNDLAINGIDHSIFDIEWAKRGGVIKVYSLVYKQPNTIHQYKDMDYFGMAKFIDDETDGTVNVYMLNKRTSVNKTTTFLAMATPYDCEKAGVEYIEPPMIWRDIESAPKDTFVIATDGFYVTEAFFPTSRNAWVIKGGGELSVTHWMPKPQPPKDEL